MIILKNNNSIWIAQKQGRSKDGNDYTDPSVIKMIHLYARKKIPVHEYLNSLNIIPISISYEKDPNDITKTNENQFIFTKGEKSALVSKNGW